MNGCFCVVCEGSCAGSATSLPVPGHQSSAEKHAVSSVSVLAPTQKRRKLQAQDLQVVQMPQSPDSSDDPEPPRKAATKITWCIACNKVVRCASPGHVKQRFAMADVLQSLPVLLWRDAFGCIWISILRGFAAHANTTAGAEDLAQCENTKAATEPD